MTKPSFKLIHEEPKLSMDSMGIGPSTVSDIYSMMIYHAPTVHSTSIPPELFVSFDDIDSSIQKAETLEDEDGLLTKRGLEIVHDYAKQWLSGVRSLEMERQYPELVDLFTDIRLDPDLAKEHGIDD